MSVKVLDFLKEKLAVMILDKKGICWKIIRDSENRWLAGGSGLESCVEPRRQDPKPSHKTEAPWSTAAERSFTHSRIKAVRETFCLIESKSYFQFFHGKRKNHFFIQQIFIEYELCS